MNLEGVLTPGEFYIIGGTNGNGEIVTFIRTEPDPTQPAKNIARVIPHTGGPLKHGEPVIIDLVPPTTLQPLFTSHL